MNLFPPGTDGRSLWRKPNRGLSNLAAREESLFRYGRQACERGKALLPSGIMTHTPRCNHVMVIEDDADIRQGIEDALLFEGYRVRSAANGREALEMLKNAPKPWRPCFILLDLMMPVMNGWEFLLLAKADPELADIPVMVCSAIADRATYPGVVDYLKKPINLDELLAAVARHCDRENPGAHSAP